MNSPSSSKKPRAVIIAASILSATMLLALSPTPASAASRTASDFSALQTCSSTYIYARANYKHVSAVINESGSPLRARADSWGAWENFGIAPYNGKYVIYSWAAERYVSANISGSGGGALQATASSIGPWELFTIEVASEGWYAIKSAANSKYVTADISAGNNGALKAKSSTTGTWEWFDLNLYC